MICDSDTYRRNDPIRVFLVDDHPVVREGLRAILDETDIHVSGEAAELRDAADLIEEVHPDVILVDLKLGEQDGTELLRYVRERWIGIKTIVVSQYSPKLYVEQTRQAGAMGYVCKDEAADHIVRAVRTVHNGEPYYSPNASSGL